MITLITGTPGAGKSLLSVWEFAKGVPGSSIEQGGQKVPRVLYSNIKDLLVEHVTISAEDLNTWHLWAKPGAVILFDEVQEVWRPRSLGVKVPDCIAKLETHRHMGVDLVLVTQHPMLLDSNIRRLVNQHIHLRRMTRSTAMVYEWDRTANPQQTRDCLHSRVWFHPKKAYALYKSAQLHTKPTARIPKVAFLGIAALAGLAYLAPAAYGRLTGSFHPELAKASNVQKQNPFENGGGAASSLSAASAPAPGSAVVAVAAEAPEPLVAAGCIKTAHKCGCVSDEGLPVPVAVGFCEAFILGNAVPGSKVDLASLPNPPDPARFAGDLDTLAFMHKSKPSSY
jgi:zona occludens toxin